MRRPNPENRNGRRNHAPDARGWRAFWASDPLLEPEDGSLHLRRTQQDPYHQSREEPADGSRGLRFCEGHGRGWRQGAFRGYQARRTGLDPQSRGPLRDAVRQPALARRHANQLQDYSSVRQAPGDARGNDRRRWLRRSYQERNSGLESRARKTREEPGRYQGYEVPSRRDVRHRRRARGYRDT